VDNTKYLKKYAFNESYYSNLYSESLIQNVYEDVIQNAISNCIITDQKFTSFNSLLNFSKSYINNQIEAGKLNLTTSNYLTLISKINELKNNELYKILCVENRKLDSSTKYNIVSKKYLVNYHN
jgi:hypothetical protein